MGGVGGGWVGWLVGEPRGIGGVYAREEEWGGHRSGGAGGGGGGGGGGGVVQFRRPLWGLENSGIVPAGMQHQQ